jgi:hypothetical protein
VNIASEKEELKITKKHVLSPDLNYLRNDPRGVAGRLAGGIATGKRTSSPLAANDPRGSAGRIATDKRTVSPHGAPDPPALAAITQRRERERLGIPYSSSK